MPEMTGAQAICETLKAEAVKYVFGLPGTTEIPLLDALAAYPEIKFIGSTPGTCYVIANLYNAKTLGVPLIVMAGGSDSRLTTNEPLLTSDLVEMTRQFTKWSWHVGTAEEIPKAMRRAFKVATTPPVGSVFLSIPQDFQSQRIDADIYPAESYHIPMKIKGDPEQLRRAAELLAGAERPTIIAGSKAAYYEALPELVELAELVGARVYCDPLPHSVNFPTNHPLYVGVLSHHEIEPLTRSCDVLLTVGCKVFEDVFYPEAAFAKNGAKVIQLDIDTWEIAKNHPIDVALVADLAGGLKELTEGVKERLNEQRQAAIRERTREIRESTEKARADLEQEFNREWDAIPIRVWRLMKELKGVLSPDSVIVDRAGGARSYLSRILDFSQPDTYFSTVGALGWGIAAAIGVKLASPDKKVVALAGDGEVILGLQGLWTACNYNIPIVTVVVNNRAYMAVKSRLLAYKGEARTRETLPGVDLENVDFVKLAEGFAIKSWRVERPEEIRPALEAALDLGKPALVDVLIDTKDAGYRLPRLP